MAKRTHIDLSDEEPSPKADPVLETWKLEVSPKRMVIGSSTHRDSHLGAGAVSLMVSASTLGCGVGAGLLAFWVGTGPAGCMISAGVGAIVALVVAFFVFKAKTHGGATADTTPETRPPVKKSRPKRKVGKKRKKRS